MQSLGLLVLLVAAASAFPTDKYFYRCIPFLSDQSVVVKHLCDSYDGKRYVVDSDVDNFEDRIVFVKDARVLPLLGGLGGSGSGSAAQSSSGSLSGGIGGGLLPFSLGASVSGSQSSAGSLAGSGGGIFG